MTIIEMLAVVIVLAVLAFVLGLLIPASGRGGKTPARQLKDATQIRSIVEAMVVFSQNGNDQYPLPSRLDPMNSTIVADDPVAKDNTGNILSFMIFAGLISPELCINPAEANTAQVIRDDGYQFENSIAVLAAGGNPELAIWDPGFAGTPVDGLSYRRGDGVRADVPMAHQSYAHTLPVGRRLSVWSNTFVSTEAVFGNRGPGYQDTSWPASGRYTLNPAGDSVPGVDSNTLLIHGGRKTWSGNIGYNDGHVAFETKPDPDGITYRRAGVTEPRKVPDNLFIDEVDEVGPGSAPVGRDALIKHNLFLRPIARLPAASGVLTEGASGLPNLWVD